MNMTSEKRAIPILPPPYIFLGPLLIGVGLNILFPVAVFSENIFIFRILGSLILLLLGILLVICAVKTLFSSNVDPRFKPVERIVSSGPFKFTRNPMYVSFTLIYLGISAIFNSFWPILFLPIILLVINYGVIRREEAYLEEIFGEEYRNYKNKVRRWI